MNPLLLAEIHKNDKIGERNETIRMFLVLIHCQFQRFRNDFVSMVLIFKAKGNEQCEPII
jgi:hypothetical protein